MGAQEARGEDCRLMRSPMDGRRGQMHGIETHRSITLVLVVSATHYDHLRPPPHQMVNTHQPGAHGEALPMVNRATCRLKLVEHSGVDQTNGKMVMKKQQIDRIDTGEERNSRCDNHFHKQNALAQLYRHAEQHGGTEAQQKRTALHKRSRGGQWKSIRPRPPLRAAVPPAAATSYA